MGQCVQAAAGCTALTWMGVSAEKTFSSVWGVDWFAPIVVVTAVCRLEGMAGGVAVVAGLSVTVPGRTGERE